MTDWQPIETAPKDGELILMAKAGATHWHNIFVAYWDEVLGEFKFHQEGYVRNPTHWMPLPAPPVQP